MTCPKLEVYAPLDVRRRLAGPLRAAHLPRQARCTASARRGDGNPHDRYGRNVYIDTYNSAYGPGWRRESGILAHRPTGTFCHSFVPQKPFPGYPSQEMRPPAPGERYRVTVMGPGVTPVIQWEGRGLTAADRASASFDHGRVRQLMAGDARCAAER